MTSAVCYAYDSVFVEHDLPTHPECADRLIAVISHLEQRRIRDRLLPVPVAQAPAAWVMPVHEPAYLDWLRWASAAPTRLVDINTYVGEGSYQAAMCAVGASVECTRAILEGRARSGLALVRPPGHHALRDHPMGFCLLNNVACAAAYALREGGLSRVLIVDFDAHHGNGTQDAFWDDPRVLYVSLHQQPLFPGSGSPEERGGGPGEGYTVNLPLPARSGDRSVACLLDAVIEPLAERFRPEMVLVSAGYDGHWRDPLTDLAFTIAGFDHLARRVMALAERHCDGRLLAVLEGGYDLQALAYGVGNLAETLLGTPANCEDPLGPPPEGPSDDLAHLESLRRTFAI